MDKMKKMLGLQHGGEEEGDKEGEGGGGGGGGIKFADAPSSPPSNKKQKDAAKTVRVEEPSDGGAKGKGPSRAKAKSATTPQSVSRRDEGIWFLQRGFDLPKRPAEFSKTLRRRLVNVRKKRVVSWISARWT